jgi:hypothetical protein
MRRGHLVTKIGTNQLIYNLGYTAQQQQQQQQQPAEEISI